MDVRPSLPLSPSGPSTSTILEQAQEPEWVPESRRVRRAAGQSGPRTKQRAGREGDDGLPDLAPVRAQSPLVPPPRVVPDVSGTLATQRHCPRETMGEGRRRRWPASLTVLCFAHTSSELVMNQRPGPKSKQASCLVALLPTGWLRPGT